MSPRIYDSRFPRIGETWRSFSDGPFCEAVVILDTLFHPDWGNYTLYQIAQREYPSKPICTHETIFIQLYYPVEETSCDPSPNENSSCTTSSQLRQPWYTALLARWSRIISFFKPPW